MNYDASTGWVVGIPGLSKQVDLAWDFLKYGWVDYSWKMGCDTLNGPCITAQLDEFEQCMQDRLGPDNRMTPFMPIWTQTALVATRFWPAIPVNQMYYDEMVRAYDYVVRGEKGAAEALQEVAATVQPELDKALQG